MDAELVARLDALQRRLDYVVERQRWTESLIEEMTPVVREALTAVSGPLAAAEARGWFAAARELGGLADRLVEAYGPDQMHELADHLARIFDTVKSFTRPEVLELAQDAAEVLDHADDVEPMGFSGAIRVMRDAEVQRGVAVALELLRHLGQAHEPGPPRPDAAPVSPGTPPPGVPRPVPRAPAPASAPAPAADEVVTWRGHAFTPEGFLVDPSTWTEELAEQVAQALGIALTEEHWAVLRWARADYLDQGASPNVRRVAAGSQVGIRRMYELFPRTPGKTTAMIAGIPKPVGCV